MPKLPPGSRIGEPVEQLEVGENPTACTHCGTLTAMLAAMHGGARLEACLCCGQRYEVKDAPPDPEDDDDPAVHGHDPGDIEVIDPVTGRVIGMTNAGLDNLLREMNGEMPEASQEDLDHLFGIKRPGADHPDFGSF